MFEPLEKFEIFKTKIDIPDYLIEKMYELKKLDKGTPKTNRGGWHSKTFTPYKNYYNGRYTWTKEFLEHILKIVNSKWTGTRLNRAWFNLSPSGSTNRWHNHGTHPIVGVIYIKVPNDSGTIEFKNNDEIFSYLPNEGDFLVFPGSLEHQVLAGKNTEDRISLAINFD
jgi:hypothetical protein